MGDDRGQSLVEFALASTVFFMTLFGVIIFGIGVWRYNMVADLAQEGARWASVHGSTSASPAVQANVQTYVQSRAPFNVTVTTTPVTVSHPDRRLRYESSTRSHRWSRRCPVDL